MNLASCWGNCKEKLEVKCVYVCLIMRRVKVRWCSLHGKRVHIKLSLILSLRIKRAVAKSTLLYCFDEIILRYTSLCAFPPQGKYPLSALSLRESCHYNYFFVYFHIAVIICKAKRWTVLLGIKEKIRLSKPRMFWLCWQMSDVF